MRNLGAIVLDRELERRLEIEAMFSELDGHNRLEAALDAHCRYRLEAVREYQREWKRWKWRSDSAFQDRERARRDEYRARPEVRAREAERSQQPEVRARAAALNRVWWSANTESINAARRDRYAADPNVRAQDAERRRRRDASPEVRLRTNERKRRLYAAKQGREKQVARQRARRAAKRQAATA